MMSMSSIYVCLWIAIFDVTQAHDSTRRSFQNVIDTASYLSRGAGLSLGVALPGETLSFAAGLKDKHRTISLGPQDKMGIGSATKSFTAAAMLNLVDKGAVGLDNIALPHMDALIRKVTSKSLVDYLGPTIRTVTVRHLLHMTSGIGDFDSKAARVAFFKNPTAEMDLHQALGLGMQAGVAERKAIWDELLPGQQNGKAINPDKKTDAPAMFTCLPGTCGEYSSTNSLLLGMILAQSHGHEHWLQYDQSSFLPSNVRQKMPNTLFPLRGLLGDFTDVHVYPQGDLPSSEVQSSPLFQHAQGQVDAIGSSANVGFTVANGLSTGADMAVFWQSLLGKSSSIISPKAKAEMLKLRWLETGLGNKVSAGQFYGMGVRDLSAQLITDPVKAVTNPEIFSAGKLYGHDGASAAGFNSFNAYAPRYDFGLSFIMNDVRAALLFNFIARKVYDLAGDLGKPVDAPVQAVYENKDAFMAQPWVRAITLRQNV